GVVAGWRGPHAAVPLSAAGRRGAGRRAGAEQEPPGRVETESAGNRFGRYVSDRRQMTGGGVDGEPGDAVMAAIADVEEFPRGCQVDLGAGIPCGVPVGQGTDGLHDRERARRSVEAIEA